MIEAFIKRRLLVTYYTLAFAISWGGILLVVGPGGIPGTPEQFKALLFFVGLAMMPGPSVAGVVLTGLVSGRAGLRQLIAGLLKWRLRARWYAVILLTAPLLMTAIPLAVSLFFPEFLPGIVTKTDKVFLLLMGVAAGLVAGFFEELGWTGFAIPRWRLRYGVFTTGLIVGFLWGAWHRYPRDLVRGSGRGPLERCRSGRRGQSHAVLATAAANASRPELNQRADCARVRCSRG